MLFWAENMRRVYLINQDLVREGQRPRSQMYRPGNRVQENRMGDGRERWTLVPHHFPRPPDPTL